MIILGFEVREATALSQSCLAGGACSALVYNLRQRHPSGKKPMIDYTLVLVMGPNLLAGALIGSVLNRAMPSWLILTLLIGILVHSAYKTFNKAFATLAKERAGQVAGMKRNSDARLSHNPIERCLRLLGVTQRYTEFEDQANFRKTGSTEPRETGRSVSVLGARTIDSGDIKLDLNDSVPQEGDGQLSLPDSAKDDTASVTPSEASIASDQIPSEPQYPRRHLLGFAFMWTVMIVSILARGGKTTPGLFSYCGAMYWICAFLTVAILCILAVLASRLAVRQEADQSSATPESPGGTPQEIRWTVESSRRIALWSLFAGTLAALCGIGGGMVMGPKLLDLGFLPQVQSATTATTLFVMSTSTTLAFLVQGAAPLDYALFLGWFTAMGAVVGKAIIGWIVKRARRPSVIMFLLGSIIATSVVIMAITGLLDVIDDIEHGNDLLFDNPCK